MNYMNVLSDFEIRLKAVAPVDIHDEEVNRLAVAIETKDHLISELQEKLTKLEKKGHVSRTKAVKPKREKSVTATAKKSVASKAATKKPIVKKTASRKATASKSNK
jgi:alpha-amylase